MPLRLHIFEARYKEMIRTCMETDRTFGVALIRRGVEAHGPLAEPYSVGCIARIVETQPLDAGRLNLVALGQERFRILSTDADAAPYLVGEIEPFPLWNPKPQAAAGLAERLRPLVEQYMRLLGEHIESHYQPEHLPGDPASLAYVAAILLQASPQVKQELLSIPQAVDLLSSVFNVYRRELALLKAVLTDGGTRKIGAFSEN
jgi:Lon protease-like protein